MNGYDETSPDRTDRDYDALTDWEQQVVNAVGRVIEFWGFKRNHGRLWAFLYMRREPFSSTELQEALELSKGAVSMITRDLLQWEVVDRSRVSGSQAWHFRARSDFLSMIRNVLSDRELRLIERVEADLAAAARDAKEEDASQEVVDRIERMRRLADMVRNALDLFLQSSQIDVTDTEDVL